MGADTKKLRSRIKSVDSTLHLTKAMGLVASSKIRKSMEAMKKSREYYDMLSRVIQNLSASPECAKSPYMAETASNKRTLIIVVAGDRGLAGGYNANVFRLAKQYPDAEFIAIGKRACDRFGGDYSAEHFSFAQSSELAKAVCRRFSDGELDRVGIISTKYISMMSQESHIRWMLPLVREETVPITGVVYEPDELSVLNTAVPLYIAGAIVAAVREGFASEVAARRCAMDSAGKNAKQMIDELQLEYNRARQGAITQEITEIVAGSGM